MCMVCFGGVVVIVAAVVSAISEYCYKHIRIYALIHFQYELLFIIYLYTLLRLVQIHSVRLHLNRFIFIFHPIIDIWNCVIEMSTKWNV